MFGGGLVIEIIFNPTEAPATYGAGVFMLMVAMVTSPAGAVVGIGRAMKAIRVERAAYQEQLGQESV